MLWGASHSHPAVTLVAKSKSDQRAVHLLSPAREGIIHYVIN
jgi:hypothetical protein